MKRNYYLRGAIVSKKKDEDGFYRVCKNVPLVSIFLIKEGELVSRGVAICGPSDNPDKYIGRWLAHINAIEARDSKKTTKKIKRTEALRVLNQALDMYNRPLIMHRSEYRPVLSTYEKDLLKMSSTTISFPASTKKLQSV